MILERGVMYLQYTVTISISFLSISVYKQLFNLCDTK